MSGGLIMGVKALVVIEHELDFLSLGRITSWRRGAFN